MKEQFMSKVYIGYDEDGNTKRFYDDALGEGYTKHNPLKQVEDIEFVEVRDVDAEIAEGIQQGIEKALEEAQAELDAVPITTPKRRGRKKAAA